MDREKQKPEEPKEDLDLPVATQTHVVIPLETRAFKKVLS